MDEILPVQAENISGSSPAFFMPLDVSRRGGRVTDRTLQASLSNRHKEGGEVLLLVHVHVAGSTPLTNTGDLSYKHSRLCASAILLPIPELTDTQVKIHQTHEKLMTKTANIFTPEQHSYALPES